MATRSPVVLGFVSAASGADVGAATGPAVSALGLWFDGGPSLSSGQGLSCKSSANSIEVVLTGVAPPATPARAVVMDRGGALLATVPLAAGGGGYSGSAQGSLAVGEIYYVRLEARP